MAMALVLLAILAPVFICVAIAIRTTSSGPVLFRQKRNGKDMVPFELLKFRTMHCHFPDPTIQQAQRGDARITPVGKFLRATSLDELPQLFNVVRGDMSLIGPRPHAVEHDAYYGELVQDYRSRFQVRPGLTGYAQVSGARGATPQVEDMERRVDLDLYYIRTASLSLDGLILIRTVREVFFSRSAY